MKIPLSFLLTVGALQGATTANIAPSDYIAFNSTNAAADGNVLEFGHENVFPTSNGQNGQGAGVSVNVGTALGSGPSSFLLDNGNPSGSLFFEFSTTVPAGTNANDELGFFFGPSLSSPQSSAIVDGGTRNAFTVFFNDGGLFVEENVNNGNTSQSVLSGLGIGDAVTIGVEVFLTGSGNNLSFQHTLTATSGGVTETETFNGAAQNLSANSIDNFAFVASSTTSIVGSISGLTISDMAIVNVPEPSAALLTLLTLPVLLRRKRHV